LSFAFAKIARHLQIRRIAVAERQANDACDDLAAVDCEQPDVGDAVKAECASFGAIAFARAGDIPRACNLIEAGQPYKDFKYSEYVIAVAMVDLARARKAGDASGIEDCCEQLFTLYENGRLKDVPPGEITWIRNIYLKAVGNEQQRQREILDRAEKLSKTKSIHGFHQSYIY
jgi:hypothetical protein